VSPAVPLLGLLARGSSMTEAKVQRPRFSAALRSAPPSEPSDGPTVTFSGPAREIGDDAALVAAFVVILATIDPSSETTL